MHTEPIPQSNGASTLSQEGTQPASFEVVAVCVALFVLIVSAVLLRLRNLSAGKKAEKTTKWKEDSGRPVRGSKLAERLEFIENCTLFEDSNAEQKQDLAEACQMRSFNAGDVMIVQGNIGDCMYIIKSGYALVTIGTDKPSEGTQVDRKKPGAFFGEVALLCDVTRTANVLAEGKLECMVISRADFQSAMPPEAIKNKK